MNSTTPLKRLSQKRHSVLLPLAAAFMSVMTVASFYPKTAFSAPTSSTKLKGTWGTVLGSQTYIRIRPSSDSPNVAKVPRGTKVMAWGTYQGWYRVETADHHFGWVHHDYLNAPNAAKLKELSHAKAKAACDSTDNGQILYGSPLQLRLYYTKYKAKGALLGLQKMGAPLVAAAHVKSQELAPAVVADSDASPSGVSSQTILAALDKTGDSASLDVNNNYNVQSIDPAKKAAPAAQKASRGGSPRDVIDWAKSSGRLAFGESVASKALSYRGMPYIFGAESPSRGFDCSGLVSYVLHKKGLHPPRTAAAQSHYGAPVSRGQLKPGDLVFFAGTYKSGVSHVGIYIGNNNFVHAANPSKGVRVDSLSSSYYARHYYGARRPPAK
jgi:cell wall-associated NlpC family hydrolase